MLLYALLLKKQIPRVKTTVATNTTSFSHPKITYHSTCLSTMVSEDSQASAVKAAKKFLKKNESMKIKALAKEVSSKIGHDDHKSVKKWIKESDKFEVSECGKLVTLKRKRKSVEDNSKSDAEKVSKKKQKKTGGKKAGAKAESALNSTNVDDWRKEHKIVLMDANDSEEGQKATKAINKMEQFFPYSTFDAPACLAEIDAVFLKQCTEVNGFSKPSPIQAQCWPILLNAGNDGKRRDVVGIAETGSGKTLAFGLPALNSILESNKGRPGKNGRAPRLLVLTPTRELAMQVDQVLQELSSLVNLRSTVIFGGVPKFEQKKILRQGIDSVVATPGRLKDFINEQTIDLSNISHLVLDEADRMLDMGFEEDVRFIISQCKVKENRQTAMFSATWPAEIQKIALEYLVNPMRVYVGFNAIVGSNGKSTIDDALSANKRVKQTVEVIEDRARDPRLRELLKKYHSKRDNRILVFALYKKEAERLEFSLKKDGWKCSSIHGNKTQEARTRALDEFKSGRCPLLVATDVAARGLDIPNVEVVLNFTFPLTIEDYVHRIGRTGRAGKSGTSHTFFQPTDKSHAGELQQVMKQADQPVPEELMKFGSTIKKKEHKLYGNFGPRGGPMKKATKITFGDDD
jgi:ATP-dependent RNA helicase DBP3